MDISTIQSPVDASFVSGQGDDYLGQVLADVAKMKGQPVESMRLAGEEFEAYFLANLMRVMRETVHEGLFENKAGKYFYYFYDTEIGRQAAKAGGIGIAQVIGEYARQQEMAGSTDTPSSPDRNLPIISVKH
jgi:Rod binding domain-containing protein